MIELLIVIVILGILAAVTVFAVRGITDKGTTSACAAEKATLATAAEAYFAQYGGTAIAHTGTTVTLNGTTVALGAAVPDPAGAATAVPVWTAGATPDDTLVAAGFLRATSAKYITSPDGKTLNPVTAAGCS